MAHMAGTFRYDQIAHDRTFDAWSMDRTFTMYVEHNLEPHDSGEFERRAKARDATAHGRVDPVRRIGSVVVRDGMALEPVLDRLCIAFPDVRWYSFEPECGDTSLIAA